MTSEPVTLDVTDGVATVTIDRPEKRNAMSAAVAASLSDHLSSIADRDDVRCVVVTGTGGAFCAGGDIERMRERAASDAPVDDHVRELQRTVGRGVASVATCPVPTIAKIDGPAVGAGATLAIACDLQVASVSAVIGFSFRQVGLSVDSGASHLLPQVVGVNTAKRLVFTGEILSAEEAFDLGLVTHVFEDDAFEAEAAAVVETVADGPTVALRHAKRLLDEGARKPYEQAVRDEAVAQGLVYDSEDHAEGVEAFLDKRDAEFEGH
jgi:enoyl-CoA hydratase/carnithine racemase